MLLVLGDIAGDGLVAELAELDAHLFGGDHVGAVAHDRPVALRRSEATRHLRDGWASGQHLHHGIGQQTQRREQFVATVCGALSGCLRDRARQQHPGRNLRVERLGAGHAHLHIAAVARVHHTVGLVGEVAVATVDDGQHRGAPTAGEIDRAIGVGGGAALADRHDEGVGHVETQVEARQLGGGDRIDVERAVGELVEHSRHAAPGHRRGALADDAHLGDLAAG